MKTLLVILFTLLSISARCQETQSVVYLSTADFKEKVVNYPETQGRWIYRGERPCIIDFFATWCGPCRALSPVLEQVATEKKGEIDVYKVDVDKERELAALFQVSSVPTILFIPMNAPPQAAKGALPYEAIQEIINVVIYGKEQKE